MDKKELIKFLKENLKIDIKTTDKRYGCPTEHEISLKLGDEEIDSVSFSMNDGGDYY